MNLVENRWELGSVPLSASARTILRFGRGPKKNLRHCERSEAIQSCRGEGLDCFGAMRLAMTGQERSLVSHMVRSALLRASHHEAPPWPHPSRPIAKAAQGGQSEACPPTIHQRKMVARREAAPLPTRMLLHLAEHVPVHPAAIEVEERHGGVMAQRPGGETPLQFAEHVLRHRMQIGERF